MTIRFQIKIGHLTDGSEVTDVILSGGGGSITLNAVSEIDAIHLQGKIWDAVKAHTNEPVEFIS